MLEKNASAAQVPSVFPRTDPQYLAEVGSKASLQEPQMQQAEP
jgi:hypothetical protein